MSTVTVLPNDIHNQRLVENVHPPAWENPKPDGTYNLVVVGAGTAGLVTAAGAAALGAKVALVERHLMGGDCLNVGCVPSKGLIRAGRALADVRDAGEFGVRVPKGTTVDFGAVMERMRMLRAKISPNDSVQRFSDLGIDVFLGHGKFVSPKAIEVDGTGLSFSRAVIATGARAMAPPIPGLDDAGHLTNETIFTLTELPKRLAVIGAGPIGCEMAQSFARFGSLVYLLELSDHILPKEPHHISKVVEDAMDRDGVNLIKRCKTSRVEASRGGKTIHFECDGDNRTVEVDEILVGVGRAPNVANLGLEAAGVAYDSRVGVTVNDYLQTTNRRVYAAGDISSKFKFTHTAEFLAAIATQNSLFMRTKKASSLTIPWSTFTDPEVAHVGLYPADGAALGVDTTTYTYKLDEVDRAILDGEENGFAEIYVKKGTDKILGATIVARHAGEMINEITLAITAGAGLGAITATIHPYPTQAEVIRKVAREYYKTRLTPRVKKLMERWMRFRR
ncbi:MAG: mercuric reductase [Spirochaetales bacterium]|nr:mercuric reductase [Spirochaetales bacterium]